MKLEALKPGDTYKDTSVKGLTLRVGKQTKGWYLSYRSRSGKRRRPRIGYYPTIRLTEAREIARSLLVRVYAGEDPSEEWSLYGRNGMTVAELCDRYLEKHAPKKKTARNDKSQIDKHIRPALGDILVPNVDFHHIEKLHARISLTAPTAANRVVSLLSKMFTLAERWGLRDVGSNPCRFVSRNRERKRKRYATDEEMQAISEALAELAKQHPLAVDAIRLLILTGARRGEIAGRVLNRADRNTLFVADTKTGDDRTIFLPEAAVDLIEERGLDGVEMPCVYHVTHVFQRVCGWAGVVDMRLHDMRHSFASVALSKGVSLAQIGELLGHSSPTTTARYAHLQKTTAQESVNLIADSLKI